MAATTLPAPTLADKDLRDSWAALDAERLAADQRLREAGWPEALVKCFGDSFDYAVGHRTLGVIRFRECADLGGGWVRLNELFDADEDRHNAHLPYPFARGVDVRVSDILWAADAPEGS